MLFWMTKVIMMKILVKWTILISLENFGNVILRNSKFFCNKNKIDEFFSYNEIIEIIGEIINNTNSLNYIFDSLDQINLKIKTK